MAPRTATSTTHLVGAVFAAAILVSGCKTPSVQKDRAEESAAQSTDALEERKPLRNLLLITVDTLRADGANSAEAPTPTFQRMRRRGWTFENAYAASMLTNPSHASILTSLAPVEHGVYDNQSGIDDRVLTLAETLRDHGFSTTAIINFPHLNPKVSNLGQGFDEIVQANRRERSDHESVALALKHLGRMQETGQRYFMWLHLVGPHAPYEPPAKHRPAPTGNTPISVALKAAPGFQKENTWFKNAFKEIATVEEMRARYYGEVANTDEALGVLMKGLESQGAHDLLLTLTSDHGENLGERDLYFHHGGLYKTTTHIPWMVMGRGLHPRRIEDFVSHLDIAPTLCGLLGLPAPASFHGRNLSEEIDAIELHDYTAVSEHMKAQAAAAYGPEGTLIEHRANSSQFPTYRLRKGSREFIPGKESKRGTEERLQQVLKAHYALDAVASGVRATNQDLESLRELGYVVE